MSDSQREPAQASRQEGREVKAGGGKALPGQAERHERLLPTTHERLLRDMTDFFGLPQPQGSRRPPVPQRVEQDPVVVVSSDSSEDDLPAPGPILVDLDSSLESLPNIDPHPQFQLPVAPLEDLGPLNRLPASTTAPDPPGGLCAPSAPPASPTAATDTTAGVSPMCPDSTTGPGSRLGRVGGSGGAFRRPAVPGGAAVPGPAAAGRGAGPPACTHALCHPTANAGS